MKKRIISVLSVLMVLTVLFVSAHNIIMKIEMKDGSIRYVDTESVEEFSLIEMDEIPAIQESAMITEPVWDGDVVWYHNALIGSNDYKAEVAHTFEANDPDRQTYTLKSSGLLKNDIILTYDLDGKNRIARQSTGFVHPQYGEIWIADGEAYTTEVLGQPYYGSLYPTVERNRITLNCIYYAPNYGDGKKIVEYAHDVIVPIYGRFFTLEATSVKNVDETSRSIHLVGTTDFDYSWEVKGSYVSCVVEEEIKDYSSEYYKFINQAREKYDKGEYDFVIDRSSPAVDIKVDAEPNVEIFVYYGCADIDDKYEDHIRECDWRVRVDNIGKNIVGNLTVNGFYTGNFETTITRLSPVEDTKDVKYLLYNWMSGNDTILIADMNARTDDGFIPITMYGGCAIDDFNDYGRVMRADARWYIINHLGENPDSQLVQSYRPSILDPATNTIYFNTLYYVPDYLDGNRYFGSYDEYFVPKDSYNPFVPFIETKIKLLDDDDAVDVIISNVQPNAPVDHYRIGFGLGSEDEIYDDMIANPENYPAIKYYGDDVWRRFEIKSDDKHYHAVGIAYDKDGNAISKSCDSVWPMPSLNLGNCTQIGEATFIDGWILPAFSWGGTQLNPSEYPYSVGVYQDMDNPSRILLKSPWADSPVASMNESPELAIRANLEISMVDDMVLIRPHRTGFTVHFELGYGEIYVGNIEGYYFNENPDSALSDIRAKVGEDALSYYENGVIVVPKPIFGWRIGNDLDFGYISTIIQDVQIIFSDGAKKTLEQTTSNASVTRRSPRGTIHNEVKTGVDGPNIPIKIIGDKDAHGKEHSSSLKLSPNLKPVNFFEKK